MEDYSKKKVLIFSDTHLTCKFNRKWFDEVEPLINNADIVIINGDFWEHISCDFSKFIKSKWSKKLFPILKNKTIYLHGNHDPERLMNTHGVILFSREQHKEFEFKSGKYIFNLEHGDKIVPDFDSDHRIMTAFVEKYLPHFWLWLTRLEDRKNIFGKYFKKYMDRHRVEETKACRKVAINNKEKNIIRIFGHIHTPKHNLEDDFIILGSFKNGNKRYITIENGEVSFFDKIYKW